MKSIGFVWLFVLLSSAMMLAQTNSAPHLDQAVIDQPLIDWPVIDRSMLAKNIAPNALSQPDPATRAKIVQGYGKLPLSFEANQGQADARVKFLSRGSGYTLFLTSDEAVFSLSAAAKRDAPGVKSSLPSPTTPATNSAVRMKLVRSNRAAKVSGVDQLPGTSNTFIGSDSKKWHSNIPTYAKVKYEGVYSGIDLVYYGNQSQLEYDFVVKPGADPRRIQFDIRGAKNIRRDKDGDLVLKTGEREMRWRKPVVYQETGNSRQEIPSHYVIKDKRRVGFEIGHYDARKTLLIDPVLYFVNPGSGPTGIVVDSAGNAYIVGSAGAGSATLNAFQSTNGGLADAFVTKLDPTGSLVYATYLGGSGNDYGTAVAIDSSGNAYITGNTDSTDFPTTAGAYQTTCSVGCATLDAFVAKLSSSGSALVYSTYLGGSGYSSGYGVAVDSAGNAYVTGSTDAPDFPTMNPLQAAFGGGEDAFATKFNPSGSALVYSTYLGGSGGDYGSGVAVDSLGNAYVTGSTSSTDFPTMNPLQATYGGNSDAFVSQLNPTGSAFVYSTYLGGSGGDGGTAIAVDSSGNAYVTGFTQSTDFPTVNPIQPAFGGSDDAFVAKINSTGSALSYSTYLGGAGSDEGIAITVDSSGDALITGTTSSTNFPTKNPWQATYAGGNIDAFVTQINPSGSAFVYSSYLGSTGDDYGNGIAVDGSGNNYVVGTITSYSHYGNTYTSFAIKIQPSPVVTFAPLGLTFGNQALGTTSGLQVATVENTGQLTLTITSITITGANPGDFAETNTCGSSIPAGGSCTVTATFTPTTAGARTASISIADNAPGSPQSLPMTGTGTVALISPPSLDFGNQSVGVASAPQISDPSNPGNGIVTVTSISITGTNSGDFSQTNNCGTAIGANGYCSISVTFTPTSMGVRTAMLSVTTSSSSIPLTVTLTGNGIAPVVGLSPSSITFPAQYVGTSGLPQTLTVTNSGTATLTITSVASSAADFGPLSNCTNPVPPSTNCTIGVFFDPTASGTRTGTLLITDNAGGSPQSITLSGAGQDFSIAPSGSSTATVAAGQTASYTLAVAPAGGFNQTVSLTCSGAPAGSTCSVPSTAALNGSSATTVAVTVKTATTSASLTHLGRWSGSNGSLAIWLALGGFPTGLVILGASGRRQNGRRRLLCGLALLCMFSVGLALTGCGGGSTSTGGGGGGGKSGTYTLTVTGTFSSGTTTLSHNTALTLVVQ